MANITHPRARVNMLDGDTKETAMIKENLGRAFDLVVKQQLEVDRIQAQLASAEDSLRRWQEEVAIWERHLDFAQASALSSHSSP